MADNPTYTSSIPAAPITGIGSHIVIAKSDRIYAEALASSCTRVFPSASVEVFTNGLEAISSLESLQIDYLVTGLRFSDTDGIDLLQKSSQQRLAKNIIVVAEEQDRPLLPNLHTTRVDAIIDTYTESQAMLRNALRIVSKGQIYISPTLRDYLVERHSSLALRQKLTASEIRVLRVIGNGSDNQEAAAILGLSAATVQTHRRSIMQKFKVSTSAKLVFEAIRLGFLQTHCDDKVAAPA